jgi:hypothetical protein
MSPVRQRTKHFVGGHPPPNISTQLIDNKGLIMAAAVHSPCWLLTRRLPPPEKTSMSTIPHEFRYALRQLRKSPGFAAVVILTLALGIGANIAVFSVTTAVLLNPSGIPHADGLVALRARYQNPPDLNNISMSAPDFGDAAEGKNIFSSAAVMQGSSYNFSRENSNPELLSGARVSSGYFDTFEARPYLGRAFTSEEDVPGAEHEVVLSYRTWKKRFGADPNIGGQSLMLNQQSYRVVGVMGPEFN